MASVPRARGGGGGAGASELSAATEVPRQKEFKLPWREAGPPNLTMIKWIRISRLSIKNSLFLNHQVKFPLFLCWF